MAKRRQRGKEKGDAIGSLRALSSALVSHGVTRSHVQLSKSAKRDDWPFARRAPWKTSDLAPMARWIRENLQEDRNADSGGEDEVAGGDVEEIVFDPRALVRTGKVGTAQKVARIAVAIEQQANLILDRKIKERDFVSRAEAEEANAAKWRAVKTALMQLPKALRQVLADAMDPGKVEDILNNALRAVCDDGFEGGK